MYKNHLSSTKNKSKKQKIGILLTNLGTPDSPTKADVKKYLAEFLSDQRVIEPPPNRFIWLLVLHGVILNIKAGKTTQNYQKIWGHFDTGSPLLAIAKKQLFGVKKSLNNSFDNLEFELGMRYGNPSISASIRKLQAENCEKIIVLPLYPQYSGTTTGSTFDAVSTEISTWRNVPELIFIQHYYQNNLYIQALANSVIEHQQQYGAPDKLIISYHGVPQSYIDSGDLYYQHCLKTSDLLAKSLNLAADMYQTTFQSIFGKTQWLQPYTSKTLKLLGKQNNKHIQVICPGFSADCLETIEEIEQQNKAYFINAGGTKFGYISALNDRDDHIKAITNILKKYL